MSLQGLKIHHKFYYQPASMSDVFRTTVLAKLMCCAPAWAGFTSAELFDSADDALFNSILKNSDHVMQPYLPERSQSQYNLRAKAHKKELISKSKKLNKEPNHRDYLVRMLYRNIYRLQKMHSI